MATATKSKITTRTFASWGDWFETLKAKQAELAEVPGIGKVQDEVKRARNGLEHAIRSANGSGAMPLRAYHYTIQGDETSEDMAAEAKRLADILSQILRANNRHANPERDQFARATLSAISVHLEALNEATTELERLTTRREALAAELEAIEGKAPKASASTLGDMRKEVENAEGERDRIETTLRNMDSDEGPLQLSQDAERAAMERLEEAEALAAMGEAGSDEVKDAKEAAAKAADALAKEQKQYRDMVAARRGLERKLEGADQTLATVRSVYHTALDRVRQADLAARESALVEKIEAMRDDLADLDRIYADLEEANPEASYGRARLTATMPYLHHHPSRDLFNSNGLEVTAAGIEE
ncbi:hypothetical protein [Billgrantia montanilacus]|uniref:Uncharacterized protein n=1 Tax=Billgrantia montanilacus TaxID=2282305 RepID=A0A368U108_9GAMM|nr:hypothetical protein [Halomonas montanilacus]RCV90501.1 hypothetical protein DU505_06075 [Halomonas montanilacus]